MNLTHTTRSRTISALHVGFHLRRLMAGLVFIAFAEAVYAEIPEADESLPKSDSAYMSRKSPGLAFLLSAAVPGTGQLYSGSKRGIGYLLAEAGALAGYVLIHRDAEDLLDQYVNEVKANVKFDGEGTFQTWNLEDFEHATLFDNWHNVYTDDGGDPIPRVGKWYWKDREDFKTAEDPTGNEIPDSTLRKTALDFRTRSNSRYQRARLFVGVLIFNHAVSAIDARLAARAANKKAVARLRLTPTFAPHETTLALQTDF